jgi:hypothetical protein
MDDNANSIESLFERLSNYGKTSFELAKLKALDKSSDAVSSMVPCAIVGLMVATFLLFVSLGMALWLGELLGRFYLGFFMVAGLWAIVALVVHFFMCKKLKAFVGNYIVKQVLK